MGGTRYRRPFVWQDEMAEVRNLFCRVAKVRRSGFTGFSLWKDEPTAETLSRNRLRRRRSQYALELTHLNYGESPYEALSHLHNIRGMCSRIQRQEHFVERKKKDYDLDLQPALLRRPVTASYPSYSNSAWSASAKDAGGGGGRPSRPGSAPMVAGGTPLHYTPCKPTILYDATHRCPRYKESSKKAWGSNTLNCAHQKGLLTRKSMASNWDSVGASSTTPSLASLSSRTHGASPISTDCGPAMDGDLKRRKDLETVYSEAETTASETETTSLGFQSEDAETEQSASAFIFSRPPSASSPSERPPSRMMSRRPSSVDASKGASTTTTGGKLSSNGLESSSQRISANVPPNRDLQNVPPNSKELGGREALPALRPSNSSIPNPTQLCGDGILSYSKPPARKGEGRLEGQRICRSIPAVATATKWKSPLVAPADGAGGLWALRQEQQRPVSVGAMGPESGRYGGVVAADPGAPEEVEGRPSTSPTRFVGEQVVPRLERISRFGSSPSTNKIAGKKEQLQVSAVQRAFDEELQQVVFSDYGNHEINHYFGRMGHQESKPSPRSSVQHEPEVSSAGVDSFEQAPASASASEQPLASGTSGDESHIMIKHSTDPYADFKNSMLRMIDEEDLYDKQWELEELFQYYMDLNPVVHHEVLKIVISDIRRDIETQMARPGS